MIDPWLMYFLAITVMLATLYYLTRTFGYPVFRQVAFFALTFVLLTPMAVSGTNSLAPAWLIAVFELLIGAQDIALQALQRVLIVLLTFFILLALVSFVRKRMQLRR